MWDVKANSDRAGLYMPLFCFGELGHGMFEGRDIEHQNTSAISSPYSLGQR